MKLGGKVIVPDFGNRCIHLRLCKPRDWFSKVGAISAPKKDSRERIDERMIKIDGLHLKMLEKMKKGWSIQLRVTCGLENRGPKTSLVGKPPPLAQLQRMDAH